MTVKELIAKLNKLPDDKEVVVFSQGCGDWVAAEVVETTERIYLMEGASYVD